MTALAISNSHLHSLKCFSAESTALWIVWTLLTVLQMHHKLVQRFQGHVLENKLFAVYLGNSSWPFVQFQSSCSTPTPTKSHGSPPSEVGKFRKKKSRKNHMIYSQLSRWMSGTTFLLRWQGKNLGCDHKKWMHIFSSRIKYRSEQSKRFKFNSSTFHLKNSENCYL